MFDCICELFLSAYFLFEAAAGKLIGGGRASFDKLFDAFLLPESERERLYSLASLDGVRELENYENYAQYCRIRRYTELVGAPADAGEAEDIIRVKGDALKKAKKFGYDRRAETSETCALSTIYDNANAGQVLSLCVLGFLLCEGIFTKKNERYGLKNLERAAKWNCVEGILLALYYDGAGRAKNLARLYTAVRGTPYEAICRAAEERYSVKCEVTLPENRLLYKAFGAGILKSESYAPQYSRFIFSPVLDVRDKERLLFSGHREAISETADLPLKLSFSDIGFTPAPVNGLPLDRAREKGDIIKFAQNCDLRGDPAYTPLCICSDSEYLLKLYSDALGKSFVGAKVSRIDLVGANDYDFEPTKNNIFVRSCDENAQNVYFIFCAGELGERAKIALRNFLQTPSRKNFRLQSPSAGIDLSAILPVCFCDGECAEILKKFCDVVTLAPVKSEEKPALLRNLIESKSRQYGVAIDADKEAFEELSLFSPDGAESAVDKIIKFNRGKKAVKFGAETLREITRPYAGGTVKFGFGGADNEGR